MSSIANKKKNNNINNNSSYLNRILLFNKYSNYNLKKKSKEAIINTNLDINKLNNSSIINNNISFQKYKKEINNKTKKESNSLNKNKENKNIFNKNDSSLNNNNDKLLRNNYHKKNLNNSLSNFTKTSFDFFKKRFNHINNNKFNISNQSRLKSFEDFSKINKKSKSNKDLNQSKIKLKNNSKKRTKTPTINSHIINNNSKHKSRPLSNNNSKEKKLNTDNIYKNSISHAGTNLNTNKLIKKKNNNFKTNIRQKIFQANNIFEQFKPKKKNKKTIMHQEELIMMHNYFISNYNKLYNKNKENEQNNENKKYQSDESTQKLKYDELNKEIFPLTNYTTKINILNSNKNNSQNNSNIKSSQLTHNMNNNESNTQLQYLNVNSAISLSTNINTNTNANTINNINSLINNKENRENSSLNASKQKQKPVFQGKKIKCIHEISKTGISGVEKKINQDRNFIFRNFVEGFENIFMGVCDGHGYFGNEISEYIKENLPMDLNRLIKCRKLNIYNDDLSEVLIDTFLMENNALLRNKQIDSDLSGSTCISVIYTPKKLIIANVGDSRCVLGSRVEGIWEYKNLSRDHKPSIKEEADRITKNGGRIRPMIDEDGCFVGPLRVYMKDKDLPGLAMTRSFGDYFASLAGTIAEPEIKEHILVPEDKFIILASDGLFEFISSEEVGNIIKEYYDKNDIVGCCEYLYKESYRKWILEEEDTVDDITIILVFFED